MLTIDEYAKSHRSIPLSLLVRTPCCGIDAVVEDPDDFEDGKSAMEREELHTLYCPYCESEFEIHVTWEPYCEVVDE